MYSLHLANKSIKHSNESNKKMFTKLIFELKKCFTVVNTKMFTFVKSNFTV